MDLGWLAEGIQCSWFFIGHLELTPHRSLARNNCEVFLSNFLSLMTASILALPGRKMPTCFAFIII